MFVQHVHSCESLLFSPPVRLNAEEYGVFLKEREERLAAEAEARAAERVAKKKEIVAASAATAA